MKRIIGEIRELRDDELHKGEGDKNETSRGLMSLARLGSMVQLRIL